jgi:hypothetical protein
MRLLEVFQKEDYQPLERGEAIPQFYENGDKYWWHNPMCWAYRFWMHGVWTMEIGHNTFDPAYLMGGEL